MIDAITGKEIINVGFDVDGVLRKLYPFGLDYFKKLNSEYADLMIDFDKVSGWGNEFFFKPDTDPKIIRKFEHFMYADEMTCKYAYVNSPAYKDAEDFNILSKTLKEGMMERGKMCCIFIITDQSSMVQRISTIEWLHKNKITEFDGILMSGIKHTLNLSYLIDDKPSTCTAINSNGGKAFLKKLPYNTDFVHEFETVYTIYEYVNYILKLESNNGENSFFPMRS